MLAAILLGLAISLLSAIFGRPSDRLDMFPCILTFVSFLVIMINIRAQEISLRSTFDILDRMDRSSQSSRSESIDNEP